MVCISKNTVDKTIIRAIQDKIFRSRERKSTNIKKEAYKLEVERRFLELLKIDSKCKEILVANREALSNILIKTIKMNCRSTRLLLLFACMN